MNTTLKSKGKDDAAQSKAEMDLAVKMSEQNAESIDLNREMRDLLIQMRNATAEPRDQPPTTGGAS